jgi:hypothetical protein
MNAQDCIAARIEGFPIPNVEKLDDLKVQIPQVIILNKQIYEIMFTLLQTHPCYLINWIKFAIIKKIDLFDDHPLAFLDEGFLDKPDNHHLKEVLKSQSAYLNHAEVQIKHDEFCYLVLAVFGGFKMIRNDRRSLNTIMMVTTKIFEFEVQESSKNTSEIRDYTLNDILNNSIECVYLRLHRLIFHSQQTNMAFIEELFERIVMRLFLKTSSKKGISDGIDAQLQSKEDGEDEGPNLLEVFDFEKEIKNVQIMIIRSKNLQEFSAEIIDNIIAPNIDVEMKKQKANSAKCKEMFSNEVLLMTLRADQILKEKLNQKLSAMVPQNPQDKERRERLDLDTVEELLPAFVRGDERDESRARNK